MTNVQRRHPSVLPFSRPYGGPGRIGRSHERRRGAFLEDEPPLRTGYGCAERPFAVFGPVASAHGPRTRSAARRRGAHQGRGWCRAHGIWSTAGSPSSCTSPEERRRRASRSSRWGVRPGGTLPAERHRRHAPARSPGQRGRDRGSGLVPRLAIRNCTSAIACARCATRSRWARTVSTPRRRSSRLGSWPAITAWPRTSPPARSDGGGSARRSRSGRSPIASSSGTKAGDNAFRPEPEYSRRAGVAFGTCTRSDGRRRHGTSCSMRTWRRSMRPMRSCSTPVSSCSV